MLNTKYAMIDTKMSTKKILPCAVADNFLNMSALHSVTNKEKSLPKKPRKTKQKAFVPQY